MTMRPCVVCGEPSESSRCSEHLIRKPDSRAKGYDAAWTRLSKRARRLQPFCADCGAVEDLQADHSPEAWARKKDGKQIRLEDIAVVCGPCNRARGAARGRNTRGETPPESSAAPPGKAESATHMGTVLNSEAHHAAGLSRFQFLHQQPARRREPEPPAVVSLDGEHTVGLADFVVVGLEGQFCSVAQGHSCSHVRSLS